MKPQAPPDPRRRRRRIRAGKSDVQIGVPYYGGDQRHRLIYKQVLMNLNLQTVIFAADVLRTLNGSRLSVKRLYSILGVD